MNAINLLKNKHIELQDLKVTIGLGWNPNETQSENFDLDVSAFMVNKEGKLPDQDYFVFYGNASSPDHAVIASDDDQTGAKSEKGDDESIQVDLTKCNLAINEIHFIVTIYEAQEKKQSFGQIADSYIRIVNNDTKEEIARYILHKHFSNETAVEFGRLFRQGGKWKFQAIGTGYKKDLAFFVEKYSQKE